MISLYRRLPSLPRTLLPSFGILAGSLTLVGTISIPARAATEPGQTETKQTTPRRPKKERYMIYVGTYTDGKSKGIYLIQLDGTTGALKSLGAVAEAKHPSFLAIHPSRHALYAVNEVGEFEGRPTGSISAFALDQKTGRLTFLNRQSSEGNGPCHLIVDKAGRHVLTANYGSGSVAVLPIQADGSLGAATAAVQHHGTGPNKARQEGPHAHSIQLDAANHFAFAPDLGVDKIQIYRFDANKGILTPHTPKSVGTVPGGGPRHFAFHPSGRFAYANNEMLSSVTAFRYDAANGNLSSIHTITTLPEGFTGENSTSEMLVHPSGKFLYCANRGHDSIAVFAINPDTGELTAQGQVSTQGKVPRNFGISPDGAFLLAANQESDTIVVFRIHPQTGQLQPTGHKLEIPKPVCIRFLP